MTKERFIGFGFILFLFSSDINTAEGQGSAVTVGDLLREVPNAVVVPCVRTYVAESHPLRHAVNADDLAEVTLLDMKDADVVAWLTEWIVDEIKRQHVTNRSARFRVYADAVDRCLRVLEYPGTFDEGMEHLERR